MREPIMAEVSKYFQQQQKEINFFLYCTLVIMLLVIFDITVHHSLKGN